MKHPSAVQRQILDLCNRISGLPTQYASLPDEQLVHLSTFFVVLEEGLCDFTDIYEEVQVVLARSAKHPYDAVFAELLRRILADSNPGNKALLLHALYRQSVCVPREGYGEYGEEEWICRTVSGVIDGRKTADGYLYDYAALDLVLDTFHLLGGFEPEDKSWLESVLSRWEKEEWHLLPVYDLAQRLRIATASNELSSADLTAPVPASVQLLESFTPCILDGADASGLIAYREALRNTYCFGAVLTEHFSALEQKAVNMPDGGIPLELLQGMLLVERMERGQADLICSVQD